MTEIISMLTGLLGEMPLGMEFMLPIFGFCIVVVGLVLISVLLFAFIINLRG